MNGWTIVHTPKPRESGDSCKVSYRHHIPTTEEDSLSRSDLAAYKRHVDRAAAQEIGHAILERCEISERRDFVMGTTVRDYHVYVLSEADMERMVLAAERRGYDRGYDRGCDSGVKVGHINGVEDAQRAMREAMGVK